MESLSSESKSLALDILYDIQSAIERLQERTKRIHDVDDFLGSSDGMILLDATCMLLIAIGESLKNLDKLSLAYYFFYKMQEKDFFDKIDIINKKLNMNLLLIILNAYYSSVVV